MCAIPVLGHVIVDANAEPTTKNEVLDEKIKDERELKSSTKTPNKTKQTVVDEQVIENIGLVTHEFPDDVHIDISKGILDPKGYNYVDLVDLRTSTEGKNKDNLFALRFESDTIDKMSVKVYAYKVPSNLKIGSYTYEWLLDCNMLDKSDSVKLEYYDFQQETMDYGFSIVDSTKGELVNLVVDKEKYNQMYFECPIKQDNVILIATAEDESGNIVDIAPFFNVSVDDSMIPENNVSTFSEETTVESDGSFKVDGRTYYEKDHQLWLKEETNQAAFYSRNNTYNPAANNLWPQSSNYPGWFGTKEFTGPLYKGRYDSTAGVYDRHGEGTYAGTTQEYVYQNGTIGNGYVTAFMVDKYKDKDDFWCACIDHTAAATNGTYTVDWYYNQVGDYKYWVGIGKISPSCHPNYSNNYWGFQNFQRIGIRYREYKPASEPTKLAVQKYWDDNKNSFNKRPDSIEVTLQWKRTDEPNSAYKDFATATLNKSNNWYYEFNQANCGKGLVRKDANGTYDWTIVEKNTPPGYKQSDRRWEGDYGSGYTLHLTNKLETGKGKVKKVSAVTDCTEGNSSYSLAGAKYGVYKSKADASNNRNIVATLTTKENGDTDFVELNCGTYYVKEISAPKGYYKDTKIHDFVIEPCKEVSITSIEQPMMDPVGVLLSKHDADTGKNVPQGDGSLEGAEYTMKYYKEILGDPDQDPAKAGKTPVRTWVFRTNKYGYTYYEESSLVDGKMFQYKVSGPELYYGATGKPSIPAGTITIQETKAPDAYHLNPEVYVRQFKLENMGTNHNVNTSNMPKQPERSFQVNIEKKLDGTNIPIPDVEFTHVKPDGTKETARTDKNGKVAFKGLIAGEHTIYESGKPFDVLLNNAKVRFKVANGKMTLIGNTSDKDNHIDFNVVDDDGVMTVWDRPNTFMLDVHKINEKGMVLGGAEFTLYNDKGCTDKVVTEKTDMHGKLTFKDLKLNHVYYLKETKAPQGYRIPINDDGSDIISTIEIRDNFNNHDGFGFYFNGEFVNGDKPFGYGNVSIANDIIRTDITVENLTTIKLPETGTTTGLMIMVIGFACMGTAFVLSRKKIK